jgi:hypothetical protein
MAEYQTQSISPEDHSRTELDKLAVDAGLTDAAKYPTKPAVADAINRVRAGEDAATVNAELAPQAPASDETASAPSDDQKARTQAADKPRSKKIQLRLERERPVMLLVGQLGYRAGDHRGHRRPQIHG